MSSSALHLEIKQALVRCLRLPMPPEEIGDSMSLFGEGLGLDSIDVLEIVLELERAFGVTIADQETGARVLLAVVNALTVDVEEWFHICGVPALQPDSWLRLPSRVGLTTRLLLDDLDEAGVIGTFFVVGWVAERYPELVAAILAGGHEVGSHSFWHRRVY